MAVAHGGDRTEWRRERETESESRERDGWMADRRWCRRSRRRRLRVLTVTGGECDPIGGGRSLCPTDQVVFDPWFQRFTPKISFGDSGLRHGRFESTRVRLGRTSSGQQGGHTIRFPVSGQTLLTWSTAELTRVNNRSRLVNKSQRLKQVHGSFNRGQSHSWFGRR
ncbi:hypothetical protein Hanom_Chr07g00612941 [Helianthus anomalus]